jgi:aminoglycoside phosphotransferase (APT) family kinase protein
VIGTAFYIMSFLDGRIFEDPSLPGVTSNERTEMWRDAVRVLGELHKVDPRKVKMEDFGKWGGYYNRQIKTFGTISEAQSKAVDVESKEPVGKIPHFEEMVEFFSDSKSQPMDRSTFVHGDYKIDNLVFHRTEPRVIGVLE